MILFLLLLSSSRAGPPELRAQFSSFLGLYGEHYPAAETRLRFKLFRDAVTQVEDHNSHSERTWTMGINQFSALTPQERAQYTGLGNVSESQDNGLIMPSSQGFRSNPASVDNVALGYVTKPKDQRGCGSCWAFAATAAFEGAYARATGVLKSFSEKEVLDCTYEGSGKDGCNGGWYEYAWSYIGHGQRLAELADAPYDFPKDRPCRYKGVVPNGIKNARYINYYTVKRNDQDLEDASARAIVSVAMVVEDSFYGYDSGIYDGCTSNKVVGHAVTLVGYDQQSWKVRNSWGRYWGEGGYVRFTRRKYNVCKLNSYAKFPIVEKQDRGESDQADDPNKERRREPNHGCSWGEDYPCSDLNCNYGCKEGTCWSQCNAICGITGAVERCENCKEWCWQDSKCSSHEDCYQSRFSGCAGTCSV